MAAFLYFLPGYPGASVTQLADIPEDTCLREVLHDAASSGFSFGVSSGPGGHTGILFSINPCADTKQQPPPSDYQPDKQTWVECKAGDKTTHWIGISKEFPPTPADLRRSSRLVVDGHYLTLLDGNEWLVPVLGPVKSQLPKQAMVQPNGDVLVDVPEKFSAVCKQSEMWFEIPEGKVVTYGDMFGFFVDVMAINYRVGKREALRPCLNLIDSDIFQREFKDIVCGWKDWLDEDAQKKTNADQQAAG